MLADKLIKINEKLYKLDFQALWPTFSKKPFALYDDTFVYADQTIAGLKQEQDAMSEDVFVSKRDEQFNGNTAIRIDNQYLAIWNADTIADTPLNKLSAMIVHEMFHAHQYENKEQRFPDELKGIEYPVKTDNFYMRYIERDYLLKAAEADSRESCIEYLSRFFTVRSMRQEIIGDFLDYEKAIETVEGSAVYVEYKAFNVLGQTPTTPGQYMKEYKKVDLNFISIRRNTYYQGMLLGQIADQLIPDWKENFLTDHTYLSDYIYAQLKNSLSDDTKIIKRQMESSKAIKLEINKSIELRNSEIDRAFEWFEKVKQGIQLKNDVRVTGFDPMNVIKKNEWLIHKNFLRIDRGEGDEVLKGPVKTRIGSSVFEICELEY